MLGLVDSFSERWLAFLWEQTVPHYWLTCFCIPMRLRTAKESLLESSISHIVILMISFNNKRYEQFISDINSKELTISETTMSISVASNNDLLFTGDQNNNITTKLYDKHIELASTL